MAELLIVRQKPGTYSGPKDLEVGDVICIRPDGFDWGRKERSSSTFEIVEVPGRDPADLEYLCEDCADPAVRKQDWKVGQDGPEHKTTKQKRGWWE